jgi:hypothetical protein
MTKMRRGAWARVGPRSGDNVRHLSQGALWPRTILAEANVRGAAAARKIAKSKPESGCVGHERHPVCHFHGRPACRRASTQDTGEGSRDTTRQQGHRTWAVLMLSVSTPDAARCAGVGEHAAQGNLFTALSTVAVVISVHAKQSTCDALQQMIASTRGLQRHLLHLNGIHAGQSADTGLIEHNRLGGRAGRSHIFLGLGLQSPQHFPQLLSVLWRHRVRQPGTEAINMLASANGERQT